MRPEMSLLLRCAAGDDSVEGAEALRRLAGAVARLADASSSSRPATRSCRWSRRSSRSRHRMSFPRRFSPSCAARSQQGVMRSLQLSGELVDAVHAMTAFGADPMPFKGPTLAVLAYGSLSLRQYEDLDILVIAGRRSSAHARRCCRWATRPVRAYNESQRASIRLSGHHEQFVNPATRADGRAALVAEQSLALARFVRASLVGESPERRRSAASRCARSASSRCCCICACTVASTRGHDSVGSATCSAHCARIPNAYWSRVWALARENGAARMVEIGLLLVESLLDGARSRRPQRRGRTTDAEAKAISELLARRLARSGERRSSVDFRVQLRSRERRRDRLRYTWHVLATPHQADVELLGLPRVLHSVYYIVRPVRLLLKHLSRRVRPARARDRAQRAIATLGRLPNFPRSMTSTRLVRAALVACCPSRWPPVFRQSARTT